MSEPEYYRLTVETTDGLKKSFSSASVDYKTLISERIRTKIKGITLATTGHELPFGRMDWMLNRLRGSRKLIPVRFMELEYLRICWTIPEIGDPRYEQYEIEGNQFDPFQADDLMQEDEPAEREVDPLTVLDPSKEVYASWAYESNTLEYICQLCELLRVSVKKIYFPAPQGRAADIFTFPGDSVARDKEWHEFFNWLAEEKQRVDRAIKEIELEEQAYRHRSMTIVNNNINAQTKERFEYLKKSEYQKEPESFLWNGPLEKKNCAIL